MPEGLGFGLLNMNFCRKSFSWVFELLLLLNVTLTGNSIILWCYFFFCQPPLTSTSYSCCPYPCYSICLLLRQQFCLRLSLFNLLYETCSVTRNGEISIKCSSCLLFFNLAHEQTASAIWSVPKQDPKEQGVSVYTFLLD